MKPWFAKLVFVIVILSSGAEARADTQVQVTATDPPGQVITLGRNQNFYLHLRYRSDTPTHLWATAYYRGKPARSGGNPSHVLPAGEGEALGWFFLFDPGTQVDEVQIRAGDGTTRGTREVLRYPVAITAGDTPVASTPPEWVTRLLAVNEAADRAERAAADAEPVSVGAIALFDGFMMTMYTFGLLGFAGPAWGLWRWRGAWRVAAALPALGVTWVVLSLFIDTARDPTSHNLWPFEIVFAGVLSVGAMLVLALLRRILHARAT